MAEWVFRVVFVLQILWLSVVLPRVLMGRLGVDRPRYLIMNNLAVPVGLLLLALFALHPAFETMTTRLLGVGGFFLLQLSPLAALGANRVPRSPSPRGSFTLLGAVHPVTIGVAVALFVLYLVLAIAGWSKTMDTGLLQIAVFVGTHVFLAGILRMSIRAMERTSEVEDRQDRIEGLNRMTPLFVYVSIGISIYYLAKKALFNLDLGAYRPTMMSAFMLLLATLAYTQLSRNLPRDPEPSEESQDAGCP